ncbi:MAG: glycosyltransferase family 4 protein [Gammaproteobacteria bacterium]|nr:glycosyltransferase family 4 protein [Gammaproteobacteria bacterium]
MSKTINSSHGGRTHAREFFSALSQVSKVKSADSYYVIESDFGGNSNDMERPKLWWLPVKVRTFLRMVLVNRKLTRQLILRLAEKPYTLLLVRHETVRIDFAKIKKRYPDITIAIELNAMLSDESFDSYLARNIVKRAEYSQLSLADNIFPVSSTLAKTILSMGISPEKIIVNPNGVDVKRFDSDLLGRNAGFREHYGIPEDRFVIGYVGGMEKYRRLPEFVEIYSRLAQGVLKDKLFLFIVGDGKDCSAVEAILKQQCADDIYLQLGWQNHTDVPNIMTTFDLAVMPYTLDYCSPLKLFEYLAMGLPTIAPDTQSVKDLFVDREHLWLNLKISDDGDHLYQLIQNIYSDEQARYAVAKRGREQVMNNYTWLANAERVISQIP